MSLCVCVMQHQILNRYEMRKNPKSNIDRILYSPNIDQTSSSSFGIIWTRYTYTQHTHTTPMQTYSGTLKQRMERIENKDDDGKYYQTLKKGKKARYVKPLISRDQKREEKRKSETKKMVPEPNRM
ncbi:hypothetical protein BLA29_008216 [Euroglyphus maynei]|uniref:Uncharacterized protein n=1 Tax=Euroglyphus maynei TaxID=6958 RepID=A0A1Y3BLH4_EURMA|nr:hypothetical protein BLA29_008216 [Euroglyphus maynei]